MATVLTDIATLAGNATFKAKIRGGIATTANTIAAAALSDPEPTPLDKQRLALAHEIFTEATGGRWVDSFALCVAAVPDIVDTSTDTEILTAIDTVWSFLAGQTI